MISLLKTRKIKQNDKITINNNKQIEIDKKQNKNENVQRTNDMHVRG